MVAKSSVERPSGTGDVSATQLAAMVEKAQEGLALLDADFNFLTVNPAYARATGRDGSDLIGQNYFDLFPGGDDEPAFRRARATGLPHRVVDRPGGESPGRSVGIPTFWDWTLTPIRSKDGCVESLVLSVVDVTTRVQARRQLEDFVHAVSHDLRSPLTAVLGQAQIIQRLPDRKDAVERSSGAIVAAARRMNAAIQDLVDLIRAETTGVKLNRLPVDLSVYVAEVKGRSLQVLEPNRIRVELPASVPPVSVDPMRLERIVGSLLSYALKTSQPATEVTVSFRAGAGEVITSVANLGPGLSAEDLAGLFRRVPLSMAARGNGGNPQPGLYVSRVLVEAHGGRIWAESEEGKGSTISFSLPVAAGAES